MSFSLSLATNVISMERLDHCFNQGYVVFICGFQESIGDNDNNKNEETKGNNGLILFIVENCADEVTKNRSENVSRDFKYIGERGGEPG